MNSLKMPQEVEVWYVLPAIRRELAKILVKEQKLSQRDVAKALGITEAAVSQYLKSKRAKGITFDAATLAEIRKSAATIAKTDNKTILLIGEIQRISHLPPVQHLICSLHKSMNVDLGQCEVCPKYEDRIAKIK